MSQTYRRPGKLSGAEIVQEVLVDCPKCKSTNINLTWTTPAGMPEYQLGDCNDCGKTWNQCAR